NDRSARVFLGALPGLVFPELSDPGLSFGRRLPRKPLGGGPVYQRVRRLFPLVPFGAEIADAVTSDLVLADKLVRAILQNQAPDLRLLLCRPGIFKRRECGNSRQYEDIRDEQPQPKE